MIFGFTVTVNFSFSMRLGRAGVFPGQWELRVVALRVSVVKFTWIWVG
jgi:hypothetical protein